MKKYDYIILGTGPAGYLLAQKISKTSQSLLAVEGGLFGGTCPNVGCEPKIFLEGAVHTALLSAQMAGRGLKPAKVDWTALMKTKKARFDSWPAETKEIYQKMCDVAVGYGHFVAPHIIEVNGQQYEGDKIIITAGHRPHRLTIPGHEFTHDSTDVLSLEKLPKHTVFIGGGYVGIELATMLAAAGSQVDIMVHHDKILRGFYQKYAQSLVTEMEKRGIRFYFNTTPTKITSADGQYEIQTDNDQAPQINAEYIVDATGRIPNTDKLGLTAAGIDYDRHGITVDKHLETNVPGVYAVGDITNQPLPKLTTVAELEAQYLFERLTGKTAAKFVAPTIGTACFAFPQIAQVGINPDDITDGDYQVEEHDLSYGSNYAGLNDHPAKLTVVYNQAGEVVGASEISSSAADDINYLVPVVGLKLRQDNWRQHILPIYPALADKIAGLLR